MKSRPSHLLAVPPLFALAAGGPAPGAVVPAAAQDQMKSNKCTKCHSTEKSKTGPSLKSIAAKYKGKADAEAAVLKSITTGPMVKLDDGTQEEHTIIKTKDAAQLKNLVQWILSH
jgi:cytochrome c